MSSGSRLARGVLAVALGWTISSTLGAQVPVRPQLPVPLTLRDSLARDSLARRDSVARRDSLARLGIVDTARARRVIKWDQEDSVMAALLQRRGFSTMRYQGDKAIFRSAKHEIELYGKPAQVAKDSAILIGDTVRYNDSTQVINAIGDTLFLRDPAEGQDDLTAHKSITYDILKHRGIVHEVKTSVVSGQRWIVYGHVAALQGDTTSNKSGSTAFYAEDGWLTSCTDSIPHYHFAAKELKFVTKNVMVARPAILYIADIPVMWLPFVFQDMRSGRRSGIIAPRVGFTELVRNGPNYRRTIEDFGYYFALSDYLDAQLTTDWRSDARSTDVDPGWIRVSGRMRYNIRDRFMQGDVGIGYHYLRNGSRNQQYSLSHNQNFSQRTHLQASLNYVTNTTVQRNTTFNPYAALQTIRSQLNFSSGRGPLTYTIGGNQTQYPGRDQLDRGFPNVNVSSKTIQVGNWLSWTPGFSLNNSESFHIDQVGDFAYRYITRPDGGLDSAKVDRNTHNTTIRFDTPLELFGFSWRNSFNVADRMNDFPQRVTLVDVNDTSKKSVQVFRRTFVTDINWETGFNLPGFSQGRWNISPTVTFSKVDGRSGLLARTERSRGKFVSQSMRPSFGISANPTFYHIFPGFGPLAGILHAITTSVSYAYTPQGRISDEFLAAYGDTRIGYLGANKQNTVSLNLGTFLEGKLKAPSDSQAQQGRGQKVKLLSVNFTPLSYDFERAKVTKSTGLTNSSFGYTMRSDLLPGLDFGVDYSLFQGDPISDTATFKPYRQSVRGTLALGATSPIIQGLGRLLGFTTSTNTTPGLAVSSAASPVPPANFVAGQPIAGSIGRTTLSIPRGQGWTMNLTYSSQRQRPPRGTGVLTIDPFADCQQYRAIDQFVYEACVRQHTGTATNGNLFNETTRGGTYFQTPPQSNAQSSMSFHITDKWAAQWSTNYDFQQAKFASQIVSLQREMHDWDAVFAFTRSPNGNFSFNFFIQLKAEPDLKFDYKSPRYGRGGAYPQP